MLRRLHIVRHGPVVVDQETRATDWLLSPDAEANILDLLSSLDPSRIQRIITSREKKAQQTGQILAKALSIPIETRSGLEEHHRHHNDFLDEAAFKAILADFFARPKERVFGDESAATSLKRFDGAIGQIMDETSDDELIVSHGRVISLFLAFKQKSDPMEIWSSLKLPDHIAIDWSDPPRACV